MDLNQLLSYSIDSGASDLHLSVGSIPMVRINGTMKPLNLDVLLQDDIEKMLPHRYPFLMVDKIMEINEN